jgi:DNA primase
MITEAHKNWFDVEKGITDETLEAFNISSDEGDWVVFPYDAGDKKRYIGPGDRKFVSKKGLKLGLFHGPLEDTKSYAFLVEGETDTMRLWQEGIKNVYGTPGLFGADKAETDILDQYDTVFVVLDNDADYNVAAKAEQSWRKTRTLLGTKARRVVLPDNVKDIVEFFGEYTIDTFRSVSLAS